MLDSVNGASIVFKAVQISFEVFPAKDEAQQLVLGSTMEKLVKLNPEYISVTFGAGGSTLDRTRQTVLQIQQDWPVQAVPHISCMVPDEESIARLLKTYQQAGVNRLVVLRGDLADEKPHTGPFRHAEDLVRYIRDAYGERFYIEVACYPEFHPESENPEHELNYLKQKISAGANGAITQYFFNADAYFQLLQDCRRIGIDSPITPGIMPITNYQQLARFSAMCGAEIPLWIRKRLQGYGDDGASIRAFGEEVVTRLCEQLIAGGASNLHFYTLNRANATLKILRNLNLPSN